MKKICLMLLACLLAFTLCACGIGNGYDIDKDGIRPQSGQEDQSSTGTDEGEVGNSTSETPAVSNSNSTNNSEGGDGDNNSKSDDAPTSNSPGSVTSTVKPLEYKGLSESAYITWEDSKISSAKAFYKLSSDSTYTQADSELIHTVNGKARVDYVGLKAGNYDFKVEVGNGGTIEVKNLSVAAYDRSGYAHFGYTSGVGAYKDDGTLKSGVKVVYFNEANKNNTVNGYAGLVKAIQSGNVCIRIVGRIATNTLDSKGKYDSSATQLKNLTNANKSDDTYYNMCDVSAKSNITIEGIGADAEFYQWGITFKSCNSVEVRNITFTDYPEDACAFQGDNENPKAYGNYWIHNNTFNIGKNNYDLTSEQDKHYGDGATDIKGCHGATYAYNVYNNCKKTGLVGGSDSNLQYNITFHHNFFNQCYSRTPLGRQANMHYYNNYYYKAGSYCMSARAKSFILSEANYAESCKTYRENKSGGAIKSFNDVFVSTPTGDITKVTTRDKTVSNSCTYGTSFDTDSSKFYYDSAKKVSKVSYLTSAEQAKTDVKAAAGPNKANLF